MTTKALVDIAGTAIAAKTGDNTHFQYSGTVYQKNATTPDPNALLVTAALGVSAFREHLSNIAIQNTARTSLAPMLIFGMAASINDNEATVRALIHAFATSGTAQLRKFAAITGSNEPNKNGSFTGAGTWYAQVVAQQFWIWDQVQIEAAAGNWTGGTPLVVGPALIHENVPLDTDIAHLAAATYTTAGIAYHMADLCDAGDFHFYSGWSGPGFRMDGKDDNGVTPAGISLGTDSLIAVEAFELQRARQIYDLKLTGGSGSIVSGHWKYTGGTATAGHGEAFPMEHSEGGTPIDDEAGHTADEWQAKAAVYVPEMVLRDYLLGCTYSIPYQVLTDPKTDGLRLGQYNLAQYPTGALSPYTALKALMSYNGGQTFVGVGSWTSAVTGSVPDCNGYALSVGAGEWWLYVLREADTIAYLTLDSTHVLEGVSLSGDGTYHMILSDTLTVWHVTANSGGGGAPVWTNYLVPDHALGSAYGVTTLAATGATSFSVIAGGLPTGVSLNTTTGAVTGTPTVAGAYPVQFRATNGSGHTDSPALTIYITTTPVFTADAPPLTGTVGVAYGTSGAGYLYAASGIPAPTLKMNPGGTMVPGMLITSDGTLSGTPSTAGSYTHATQANNTQTIGAGGITVGASHTIVIGSGGGGGTLPVWQDTIPAPSGTVGAKYGPDKDGDGIGDGFDLSAYVSSGSEACTFTVASGTLPGGMVLTAGGKLRNSPNAAGTYTLSVNAKDSAGTTPSPEFTITVVDNGGHGAGSTLTYLLSGPNSAFSVCEWFQATTMDGSKPQSARFAVVQDVNGLPIFVIRVKSSGKLEIDDTDGNKLGDGDNFRALFSSDPSARWRLGCVVGYDGTSARLIATAYANPSGVQVADSISVTAPPSDAPFQVELGCKSGEIYDTFDTVRVSSLPQEIPPENPIAGGIGTPLYSLAGPGPAPATQIIISARFDALSVGQSVNLAWSTDVGMAGQVLVGAQTINADSIAKWTVGGLSVFTRHYFRLVDPTTGDYLGDPLSYSTMPDGSAPFELRIANVSCMNNPQQGGAYQGAWQDIKAWAPHIVVHSGDWGYWGQGIDAKDPYSKDLQKYDKAQALLPTERAVFHQSLIVPAISDHELHVNGDLWDGTTTQDPTGMFNCPHTVRQILAFQALMPITQWGDTRSPRKGRYFSFPIGTQVKVIVVDFRTPERSNANDTDSSAKTMYGATQYAWIKSQLDPAKLNIIVHETSNWDAGGSLRATDKPAAYHTNQVDFNDYINGGGIYTGGPQYAVAWLGGDRHRVSYLSSADNAFGHFPQFIGSGLLKDALAFQAGENATWSTWTPSNTVDKFEISTWQQLTLKWDGSSISITINGRWGNSLTQVSDGQCTSGQTTITSPSGPFLKSHEGKLIAGDGIVNTKVVIKNGQPVTEDSPTFIQSYLSPTQVVISQGAKSNQAAGSWTLQNDSSTYQFSDYPGGTPAVETWSLVGGIMHTAEWIESH